MDQMNVQTIERIYAGWLAKNIGIRYGAPVESWTYEKIRNHYGELDGYLVDYRDFAADDDSNGPLFFLRALEDSGSGEDLSPEDVAQALLNYAPFEHGFFWWGGYGISTEHTAYLNLRNGIPATRSGSILQNGATIAEQIGGQIFSDTWGLVCPGRPDVAARLAKSAATVTHDRNAVYGGMFVAACISCAFVEQDIRRILEIGLSYIPEACAYSKAVRAVMDFHHAHPDNWTDGFRYVSENFGYDRYPGNCHIIPNIAVMILALLYGEGDFSRTLSICNMCGWDTDCNVGNVATIMGVRCGLAGIDYHKWIEPIHDLQICSSVIGSLNLTDIPYNASYMVKQAAKLANQTLPEPWKQIIESRIHSCHFEYPGSTHAIRVRCSPNTATPGNQILQYRLENTTEAAATGTRSLKVTANPLWDGDEVYIYQKTYYAPEDLHDSRYDPCFSPVVYPGQTLHGSILAPEYASRITACLYVHDRRSGQTFHSKATPLRQGSWHTLQFQIPPLCGGLIDEIGFRISHDGQTGTTETICAFIDDLYADGQPDYTLRFDLENVEFWTPLHQEISQMSRYKGIAYLCGQQLELTCADCGEVYTGGYDWKDYLAEFWVTPCVGGFHGANFRVQGAQRSYAAVFSSAGKVALLKKAGTYHLLQEVPFPWEPNQEYHVTVSARGNALRIAVNGQELISWVDTDHPYLYGCVGLSVMDGSHMKCRCIQIH